MKRDRKILQGEHLLFSRIIFDTLGKQKFSVEATEKQGYRYNMGIDFESPNLLCKGIWTLSKCNASKNQYGFQGSHSGSKPFLDSFSTICSNTFHSHGLKMAILLPGITSMFKQQIRKGKGMSMLNCPVLLLKAFSEAQTTKFLFIPLPRIMTLGLRLNAKEAWGRLVIC